MELPDRTEYPIIGVIVPFLILFLYIGISALFLPPLLTASLLTVIATYIVSPIGRWAIPVMVGIGFPWWYAGFTIFLLDLLGALFMAWNFQHLFALPKIGSSMQKLVFRVEELIGENPWMERFTLAALLLYVTLPVHGAGALMGSMIGRFLGHPPWRVFLVVATGSLIGSSVMALGSDALRLLLISNIAVGTGLILLLIIITAIGYLGYRSLRRRRL
ncbi:MAG: hypothetical protein D5R99_02805 [Methanocalculus sp. MSAO_Arc1]|uniref:small multi-drug export protein n=1 Tax=Methanocalculus TaxID=71151 RepID=UPI000FF22C21|nr:small multi-drug export protein [Methanocalculus sp. MSAO_Arc1]MCP1661920.1 putative membrane protein [Methanocalculus sp. AMF5]RQD81196.1 MAG: hypothetical protein D5R99_02805 [Methanocalculus sp. MSAO_Arc1]